MRIRTKLRIGTSITAFLVLLSVGMMLYVTLSLQHAHQKQGIAEEIVVYSLRSAMLRGEYVQYSGARVQSQWISLHETRVRVLEENASLFSSNSERALFEKLLVSLEKSRSLFEQMVKSLALRLSEEVIQELNNQMSAENQFSVTTGENLLRISREQTEDTTQVFSIAVLVIGLLLLGISTGSYFINKRITRSIQILGDGTRRLASGDLTYQLRVEEEEEEEVADVMRLFNRMAREVQTSHATLEQKVEERSKEISTILGALDKVALVSMTDVRGNIIYVNDRFVEVSQYSREELIGQNHRIIKSGKQPDMLFIDLWKAISQGKIWRGEIMNRAKGGTYYWVDTSIAPVLNSRGNPERYISVRFLITEQKRIDNAKSEFISLASHQLRTPLTEIRWALSSLKREALQSDQKHTIDVAHQASLHMADTIKTMLTISHIETGEIKVGSENVHLRSVLDATLQLYDMHRHRKSLKTTVECSDTLTLRTDEKLLKEVLSNLISNAYKYSPHGGEVTLKAWRDTAAVRISVEDTGIGIPLSEQPRLSSKFFRASNVMDTKEEGSGIGLYVVYALTALLGGTIVCSSKENSGTTFTLIFPSTV